jgi:hypothetical protein
MLDSVDASGGVRVMGYCSTARPSMMRCVMCAGHFVAGEIEKTSRRDGRNEVEMII